MANNSDGPLHVRKFNYSRLTVLKIHENVNFVCGGPRGGESTVEFLFALNVDNCATNVRGGATVKSFVSLVRVNFDLFSAENGGRTVARRLLDNEIFERCGRKVLVYRRCVPAGPVYNIVNNAAFRFCVRARRTPRIIFSPRTSGETVIFITYVRGPIRLNFGPVIYYYYYYYALSSYGGLAGEGGGRKLFFARHTRPSTTIAPEGRNKLRARPIRRVRRVFARNQRRARTCLT